MSLSPKNATLLKPACEAKIAELLNQAYELCELIGSTEVFDHVIDQFPEIEKTEGIPSRLPLSAMQRSLNLSDEEESLDNEIRDVNLVTGKKIASTIKKRRIKTGPLRGVGNNTPISEYKGVSWQESSNSWRVRINYKGKPKEIGIFPDEVQAAKAYDKWKYKATGYTRSLNFPQDYE